ncbi:class I SAM-dependent methyltransferase family protein [Candidatus Bathycorpusculum sp.]|uniref:class I SAM-dependent methyltransferase n=1 Tax=Candidatus Bathycorpusculum sp. TaxID=2994959 RepID=UPI0028381A87|nr:class I SAM-dependent methyltransferase family protein [Candidatus Termitimicrobium sp.]
MRVRLREKLANQLPPDALSRVYSSFDIVGDIAIIKAPSNPSDAQIVAKQIMETHKKIRTVFSQTSPVENTHRIRKLTLLLGENTTLANHREAGCNFKVDVEKCYFSPRLSHEHLRIAQQISTEETVVNMFAGVGCFSVIIAKTAPKTKVYSIDINPTAYQLMAENIQINNVKDSVYPLLGDSKELVETQLQGTADRVLMPLPELALQYLPTAVSALKKTNGLIHYYDFEHATRQENPVEKTQQKVAETLDKLGVKYRFKYTRIVRSTGPNWYQTVLDIQIAH